MVAVSLSIPAGAAAEPTASAAASQGGTTFDPSTGVITVIVDLKGALDANGNPVTFRNPDDGKIETAQEAWQQRVDDIWNGLLRNGGFDKYGFRAPCGKGKPPSGYTFQLNFIIIPAQANAPNVPGHHEITFVPKFGVRDTAGAPGATPTADGDGPYKHDEPGHWGEGGATDVAHEVGHLMGLGDDYKDVTQNGQTVSVPITRDGSKRAGTIMATNGAKKIDQQDVQRLGNQIKKAGHKLPDLCQVTYDVTVSVSQSTQTTNAYPSGDVDTAGSEDITETWVGIFDNWPEVLEKEPGGIYIESRGDDSEGFWGGSTQGEIKFNETQNDYGGPCSGDIKTPLYGASAGWNGGPPASGAPVLSFHSSLSDADADAFTALVSSQEHADCPARNSLYPPYEPLSTGPFDAYPEWGGGLLVSGGTRWSASPSAMADGFDHLTGASFEPYKMLAHGASTSLFSGTFTDLTTGCTDSLCTFNYGANMSVIFRRVD